MTRPRPVAIVGMVIGIAVLAWLFFAAAGRLSGPAPAGSPGGSRAAAPAPSPTAERKINATLFFVSEDGLSLVAAQREVPYGEPISEQARHIVEAQLGAPPARLVNAIPQGTTLKGVFVSEAGDAFVDLSADVTAKHTGGALNELFTVYALVNALTVSLPAVTRVQILIEGKEVETLAGHVDLRHPFRKSLKWIRTNKDAS